MGRMGRNHPGPARSRNPLYVVVEGWPPTYLVATKRPGWDRLCSDCNWRLRDVLVKVLPPDHFDRAAGSPTFFKSPHPEGVRLNDVMLVALRGKDANDMVSLPPGARLVPAFRKALALSRVELEAEIALLLLGPEE